MGGFVYILTNKNNTTLYIRVTANLFSRICEHKNGTGSNFTKKYNLTKLIYYEEHSDIRSAIRKEKQIKGWLRKKKIELVNNVNPHWEDLFEGLY